MLKCQVCCLCVVLWEKSVMSFNQLINKDELQSIQNEFCQATNVCMYCLDESFTRITEVSGKSELSEQLAAHLEGEQVKAALERVEDGSLEEVAIEDVESGLGRVAAIAVRLQGKTWIYWIVVEDGNRTGRDDDQFGRVVDLIRNVSCTVLGNKLARYNVEAESGKADTVEAEMDDTLSMIEATTDIVQLLDSEERLEIVTAKWLGVLGKHLKVDTAEILQIRYEEKKMDVLSEWCNQGVASHYDRTRGVDVAFDFDIDKPVIISTTPQNRDIIQRLEPLGRKAVMLLPVMTVDDGSYMVLVLNHCMNEHIWSVREIKFTTDAVKILQSILTKQKQKDSLAESNVALEAILDHVGCAIYVADKETGKMLFGNKKLKNSFPEECYDNSFSQLFAKAEDGKERFGSHELYYEETRRWYDIVQKDIAWMDGKKAILYSLYDVTETKIYQKKIEQQANTDFLTGLYNRMCCERDLARQIDEAKKNHEVGAVFYIDLDDFKNINDGLGHRYGDALLKAISSSFRRVEGLHDSCYRMGGDEFVIVVSPEAYQRIDAIIEEIKEIFSKPWFLKNSDYYCTMSMGTVEFPTSGDSVAELIKKADIAMYESKKAGKNRITKYDDSMLSVSGKRLDMERNMRDAAATGYTEFEIYYQPIINVEGQESVCAGAEALIRWNSEKLGFISPADFIPLAEYLGLINPIGNYVLREACTHCKAWNDNGYPDYKVNVNLSVVQLLQNDVVETIEEILEETGLNPRNLTLEVTESLAINDMERMKEILGRIKQLGVKIALDDFGTGYSSLNHIREIPLDVIKVDQSFVKELAEDAYSKSFVKMVAELAETIGVSVCVEGIESIRQYMSLQGMKVKYIQGFYYDRPMPRENFEAKYAPKMKKSN